MGQFKWFNSLMCLSFRSHSRFSITYVSLHNITWLMSFDNMVHKKENWNLFSTFLNLHYKKNSNKKMYLFRYITLSSYPFNQACIKLTPIVHYNIQIDHDRYMLMWRNSAFKCSVPCEPRKLLEQLLGRKCKE